MQYIVYKTTNLVNGMIYVGCHGCESLDDGYMGSGRDLKMAFEKYGLDSFTRNIIAVFDNPHDAFSLESDLVDVSFVSRPDTYNVNTGGYGGFAYINTTGLRRVSREQCSVNSRRFHDRRAVDAELDAKWRGNIKAAMTPEVRSRLSVVSTARSIATKSHIRLNTPEAQAKQKLCFKGTGHQQGETNSQFGTMWIHSVELGQNKKHQKSEPIPDGWFAGGKMKFH